MGRSARRLRRYTGYAYFIFFYFFYDLFPIYIKTPKNVTLGHLTEDIAIKTEDLVNHPAHYNSGGGVECIEAIESSMSEEEFRGYLKGSCQKYLWRYTYKGAPVSDLKKCQFYLSRLIENFEKPKEKTYV